MSDKLRSAIQHPAVLLGSIFVLAAVLRLLFFNGLNWDDDPDYVHRAYRLLIGQGFIYQDKNGFRIGTYYPAALAYGLLGVTNAACGAYALAVSLLSIIAVYRLGRLLCNVRTGLVAALLLAFYPLDIELASRLMPDGLLAGFSLFTVYFLLKADKENLADKGTRLQSARSYFISGLLLGWCTLVNMSAVAVALFIAAYFFFSIFAFRAKLRQAGLRHGFVHILVLRYLILGAGFLTVAGLEGLAYYKACGDFFFKYTHTLEHYASNHGFCTEQGMYPKLMFHLRGLWSFELRPKDANYYGFYYLAALPAVLFGLLQRTWNAGVVILWLLIIFGYLQWGSMSLTEYRPLHRLPRHLSLATPAMVLCLACFWANLRWRPGKLIAAPVVVGFLILSSVYVSYYRHEHLTDSVLPQAAIHQCLERLKPKQVYAANNTLAYQKFLDRFEDRGRQYTDIRRLGDQHDDNAVVIIGEFRNWTDVVRDVLPDPWSIPLNWQLVDGIEVPGRLGRPPYAVKVFQLLPAVLPELAMEKLQETRALLTERYPAEFGPDTLLILGCECRRLDGVEEIYLRGNQLRHEHVSFNQPEEVTCHVFNPVPESERYGYRLIKEHGRGAVSLTALPTGHNSYTLAIRLDDGPFASSDAYRFFVVADPPRP